MLLLRNIRVHIASKKFSLVQIVDTLPDNVILYSKKYLACRTCVVLPGMKSKNTPLIDILQLSLRTRTSKTPNWCSVPDIKVSTFLVTPSFEFALID